MLTSRRGPQAPGAAGLVADLAALGCEATVVACDVGERDEVARLLRAVPADRPLRAVVHAAGELDDGLVTGLDDARLDRVLHAKANGARHLHELTQDLELSAFVLFSSASATFGAAGQANYAAANAFLDALAHHRRARGLTAVSMAWGPWAETSGMTSGLTEADVRRVERLGLTPLSTRDGMALFDAVLGAATAVAVPMILDTGALRTRSETVPPLLRDLVGPGRPSPPLPATTGRACAAALPTSPTPSATRRSWTSSAPNWPLCSATPVPRRSARTGVSSRPASTPSPASNCATGSPP